MNAKISKIDKKLTSQVRIDAYVHRDMKIAAARQGVTLRRLVEQLYLDTIDVSPRVNGERG